jgi:hypothetical protein
MSDNKKPKGLADTYNPNFDIKVIGMVSNAQEAREIKDIYVHRIWPLKIMDSIHQKVDGNA